MTRSIDQIIADTEAAACLPSGITKDMRCRTFDVSLARNIACYIARVETHRSFNAIAAAYGDRDHKMALNGFNRISVALRNKDHDITRLVAAASQEQSK